VEKSNIPNKTKSTLNLHILSHQDYTDYQKYTNQTSHKTDCYTYNLSHFLAQTLQLLTEKSESHITNSTDFIQKI